MNICNVHHQDPSCIYTVAAAVALVLTTLLLFWLFLYSILPMFTIETGNRKPTWYYHPVKRKKKMYSYIQYVYSKCLWMRIVKDFQPYIKLILLIFKIKFFNLRINRMDTCPIDFQLDFEVAYIISLRWSIFFRALRSALTSLQWISLPFLISRKSQPSLADGISCNLSWTTSKFCSWCTIWKKCAWMKCNDRDRKTSYVTK